MSESVDGNRHSICRRIHWLIRPRRRQTKCMYVISTVSQVGDTTAGLHCSHGRIQPVGLTVFQTLKIKKWYGTTAN